MQIDKAIQLAADYVEVRFDFIDPNDLPYAIAATRNIKRKAVFTMRSRSEGGRFPLSEEERLLWLSKLANERPMLLDVEFETLRKNDSLLDYIEEQNVPILVSWHDFSQTPSSDKILEILSEMRIYSNYIKLVTTARSTEDSLRLLEISKRIPNVHAIIFAMGEAGVISRILCTIIGDAPFTYASLEKAVVPGQLTLDQMKSLYDSILARFQSN